MTNETAHLRALAEMWEQYAANLCAGCDTCDGARRQMYLDNAAGLRERLGISEGVGTGAGEGATGQDTGTAWVTRSADCPEAPAQAHPLAQQEYLAWNDAVLEACETARCICGHAALDHSWHGCEECVCAASGIHAVLVSGVVTVALSTPPEMGDAR